MSGRFTVRSYVQKEGFAKSPLRHPLHSFSRFGNNRIQVGKPRQNCWFWVLPFENGRIGSFPQKHSVSPGPVCVGSGKTSKCNQGNQERQGGPLEATNSGDYLGSSVSYIKPQVSASTFPCFPWNQSPGPKSINLIPRKRPWVPERSGPWGNPVCVKRNSPQRNLSMLTTLETETQCTSPKISLSTPKNRGLRVLVQMTIQMMSRCWQSLRTGLDIF